MLQQTYTLEIQTLDNWGMTAPELELKQKG